MEEVNISDINLGHKPPVVHKIYPPSLDERGVWVDADISYEGLVSAALSTKLNLMRLRRQETDIPVARSNSNGKRGLFLSIKKSRKVTETFLTRKPCRTIF